MSDTTNDAWQNRLTKALSQEQRIEQFLNRYSDFRFEYPWSGLEQKLSNAGHDGLRMIGYGSLLNPESAAITIRDTPPTGHPPVLAFGAKRIFNYLMPNQVIARYDKTGQFPADMRAALNARFTGRVSDILNGRLITVDLDDLDALREREKGYDLLPVACVPWQDVTSDPQLAFVLCATERPWKGQIYVSDSIQPFPPYLAVCRDGARQVDEAFHQCFIETTVLADATSPLAKWSQLVNC